MRQRCCQVRTDKIRMAKQLCNTAFSNPTRSDHAFARLAAALRRTSLKHIHECFDVPVCNLTHDKSEIMRAAVSRDTAATEAHCSLCSWS